MDYYTIHLPHYWDAIFQNKMKKDVLIEILRNQKFSHIQRLYFMMQNDLIEAENKYEIYHNKLVKICTNKKFIENDKQNFEKIIKRLWCWISYIRFNFIE